MSKIIDHISIKIFLALLTLKKEIVNIKRNAVMLGCDGIIKLHSVA